MAVFTEPTKWAQTLGQDADVVSIPDTAGETDPSIDKIFPSVFSIPLAQGGRAIPRSVLNGLFKLLGDWIYYIQNGGITSYSASLDYAVGSFVKYNDEFYRCIQANGASTTVKAPTEIAYWSKITTLADVANAFANQDLSNLSASGQALFTNKANKDFTNIDNTAKITIAHNAMPSNVYDTLTLGASGTEYTAPADGWFSFAKQANASGQLIQIQTVGNSYESMVISTASGNGLACNLAVKKGKKVKIFYTAGGQTFYLVFIYAVGSESEQ